MPQLIETFDLTQICQPAQLPGDARQEAVRWGANLTITRGQAIGVKTADGLCYPFAAGSATNEVQTVTTSGTTSAGTFTIEIAGTETGPIAWNASVANVQTALDAAFGASQIVAGGTINALTLTFSGANFAGAPQPLVIINDDRTGSTGTTVAHTTPGSVGAADGTEVFKGFAVYSFMTDANGNVFYGPAASTSFRTGPWLTSPIWLSGIFNPTDVTTRRSPAAEVDTFTLANVTNGDTYTLTYTDNSGATKAVTYTAGGTDTVATASAGLIALWNADPDLGSIAVASGTTTVILTGTNLGGALKITGSKTGTGTITKAVTTAASGRNFADVQTGVPGARILPNGFWKLP